MEKKKPLDAEGFDLWSENYDQDVEESDEDNRYPFAAYKAIQEELIREAQSVKGQRVLDLGIGTASLAKRLAAMGYEITGVDFSEDMLEKVRQELPEARLLQADLTHGIPHELLDDEFDLIFCNYAIHHLDLEEQLQLIEDALELLSPHGSFFLADVMTQTREEMEALEKQEEDIWDPDEFYPVVEEFTQRINAISSWKKMSYCSGILELKRKGQSS